MNDRLLKIIAGAFKLAICLFRMPVGVPTKRATVSLINVKSCNELLCMLLIYIRICLKSVLSHTFLILRTSQPDNLYSREEGCEDPWLFFEAKKGP